MWVSRVALVSLMGLCLTSACYRGYKDAKSLDSDDRGPTACAKACQQLGLQMSAFILVEHEASGCVCSPPGATPSAGGPAGAAAAAEVLMEQERARQAQQVQTPPAAAVH